MMSIGQTAYHLAFNVSNLHQIMPMQGKALNQLRLRSLGGIRIGKRIQSNYH
jgi:hypothetical protein